MCAGRAQTATVCALAVAVLKCLLCGVCSCGWVGWFLEELTKTHMLAVQVQGVGGGAARR